MDIIFETISGTGGHVGTITLNRPHHLNALSRQMCSQIQAHLQKWAQEKSVKAVFIQGTGARAFCAGGDIRAIYEFMKQGKQKQALGFFENEYKMNQILFNFPKPYLAFLEGITMGGGVGISIHGSHCIATENLVWAMPEAKLGFFPDVGVGYHLARMPDYIGLYLAMTGVRMTAADAFYLGIIKAVVPHNRLEELKKTLIEDNFQSSDFPVVTKIISQFHQLTENFNLTKENRQKIKRYFSGHSVEDIIKNLERGADEWCHFVLQKLAEQSPLSLKITYEHIRRCQKFNFNQVIEENGLLAQHFIYNKNFMEGIRAAIIDKDRNPQWDPSNLEDVSPSEINKFFSIDFKGGLLRS